MRNRLFITGCILLGIVSAGLGVYLAADHKKNKMQLYITICEYGGLLMAEELNPSPWDGSVETRVNERCEKDLKRILD